MRWSADIARFLSRLPPALAASFSPEQLAAIELHFSMRNRVRHTIDWRWRVPFLRGYLVVLAGRERR
ncbi:MAG: hypothetical protein PHU07_08570 [Acidocella sp.]|nr:hypothetical protein [Acidocella sp.]